MISKDLPGSEPDVTYGYDNLGRLTSATQSGNALSFTYDALGRTLTQAGPRGIAYSTWDAAGRRTQLRYPGSSECGFSGAFCINTDYLTTGEVSKIRENDATSGVGVLASYDYDSLGRRTSVTFGNGVVQAFTWDPVSRLASLTNDLPGTANDLTISGISYNPASQITSLTRSNDAYAFTPVASESSTGVANGLNQLTSYAGKSLTYTDQRGNVTAFGTDSYGYSSENLLTSGPIGKTLSYDPLLRLYQSSSASGTAKYAYDGLDMLALYEGSNGLKNRFVFDDSGQPIVSYGAGTSNRQFLSADERGSIISSTDSSGALIGINTYDEYGNPGATNVADFGYTGQLRLPTLKLNYYKARMYNPELGRFMQTDPIGYEDSPNLYAYVGDDPVNLTDPTGMEWRCWTEATSYPGYVTYPGGTPTITAGGTVLVQRCANESWPGQGGTQGTPPGVVNPTPIVVTGKKRTQRPTQCQLAFLRDALGRRGLPTAQLNSLKFVAGLGPNANAFTRSAFRGGAIAVTQGNTVYVQPARFAEVANFRSPIGFEEAYHSAQFALEGGAGFYRAYGLLSLGGLLSVGRSYKGNIYESFAQGASAQIFSESQSFMCRS